MPKGVESLTYEGVSFNKSAIAKMSLADFQKHEAHHGLSDEQLKEAWQLARGTKDVEDVKHGELADTTIIENLEKAPEKQASQKGGKQK